MSLIFHRILGPLVLGWAPKHLVLGAQLAPDEKRFVCIPGKSSSLAAFWTVNDWDRFQDDMAERERLGKERDSERETRRERERGIKTETSRWIHSTYHKIALINQIFTH